MLSIIANTMGIATRTDKRRASENSYIEENLRYLNQERQSFSQAQRALEIARISGHW